MIELFRVRRDGVEPPQPAACGLQPRGLANAQPTHGLFLSSSTGGNRTPRRSRRFELRRFTGLRTVPWVAFRLQISDLVRRRRSTCPSPNLNSEICNLKSAASPIGFEPTASTLTGWRALQAAPRGRSVDLLSGPGGIRTHSIPGSKPRWSASCLPSRVVLRQCPEQDSNLQASGFKPDRSTDWRIQAPQ